MVDIGAAAQAVDEGRHLDFDTVDRGGIETVAVHQRQQSLDGAVGGAAAGHRFVGHLGDAPRLAQVRQDAIDLVSPLEQGVIPIGSLEDPTRPGQTAGRHVMGHDRGPGTETELHGEQGRYLRMGLHGAADLAEQQARGIDQASGIDAIGPAQGRDGTKSPCRRRAKEGQSRRRPDADRARDVCPEDGGAQQLAAAEATASFSVRQ